jgi:hypothetical protein
VSRVEAQVRSSARVLAHHSWNKPPRRSRQSAHARLRAPGELASAQLKSWHILRKLHCCPWRRRQLTKAIHVFQTHTVAQ